MENHTGDYDSDTHNTIRIIEDELLELKKQECDLCSRLRLLQDTIVRKRTLAQNLKNSLSPVNHLPNEILLACFRYSVQSWVDENIGTDERAVSDLVFYEWAVQNSFKLPRTPAFAISQVSHRWRQLAIDIPTFWTNLVITPIFEDHLDVFQDFLCRAKDKPITVNFRSFAPPEAPRPTGYTLMEAIMPRIDMQQIHALTFLTLGNVLPFLLSQTSPGPPSPSPITFSRLIELSIFGLCDSIEDPPTLTFTWHG
ncbi:hypothetical protein BJ138DRAFT_1130445 [Hygrophoropsis aurantiaca]|uniref:Uncharacterized protein n=1 Tax=Hygrophoropsis aurantiaca TaxID=72124 RepID=A0ACB7ZXQ8_9AGAM|nr:hypothetical protein BJ138DRAFT_1130445 [Hygrophoropsis aurantiaca]